MFNPTKECSHIYQTSEAITYPLVNLIVTQDPQYSSDTYFDQIEIKRVSRGSHHSALNFQIEERKEYLLYTGEQLSVLGTLLVHITYQDQHIKDLDLLVVKGDGPSLFGRNWLDRVRLDWSNIYI